MKIKHHIFTSKLARRIFVLFFLCALIPVCGLAVISYQHVNRQLDEQFHARLKRSVKSYSLFLYERFLILETELKLTATHLSNSNAAFSESVEDSFLKRLQDRFTAMNLVNQGNRSRVLFGRRVSVDSFNERELGHLTSGNSVVKSIARLEGNQDLIMMLQVNPDKPGDGYLVAAINPEYILALNQEYHLPRNTDLLVRDKDQATIFSSLGQDASLPPNFFQNIVAGDSGNFEFEWANDTYLACFRWIFMEPKFLIPGFSITFVQSENDALLHLFEFNKIFPQVITLSILVVVFLSFYFIHRSLEPLKILKEGAHQIAARNFNHRVEIASRDEFEEVAKAFNRMSVQLHDQFYNLTSLTKRLDRLNWGALKALARAVDAKSSWTAGHSERVTQLALNLANLLINDPKERENLHRAALLHDIGKLGIQAAIIDKPEKLSDEEFKKIKSHPEIGARILEPIEEYQSLIPIVLQHHERFDGEGYPNGLAGNEIHLGARILAVADVFDSMISDRPYREGMPFERVIEIMREESGQQFDPQVIDAFISIIYKRTLKAA